jgi:hypothetical protein
MCCSVSGSASQTLRSSSTESDRETVRRRRKWTDVDRTGSGSHPLALAVFELQVLLEPSGNYMYHML